MAFEAGGKVVSESIGVFKDRPIVFALIIVSFALIGLLYFQSYLFTAQRRENVALFIEVQREVQTLLSKCIIPPPPAAQQRSELKTLLQTEAAKTPSQP